MSTYPTHTANDDGWTHWIQPTATYQMACCDCGLVHTFQFRTADDGLPEFRVRRNGRSTGQMRRWMAPNRRVHEAHTTLGLTTDTQTK